MWLRHSLWAQLFGQLDKLAAKCCRPPYCRSRIRFCWSPGSRVTLKGSPQSRTCLPGRSIVLECEARSGGRTTRIAKARTGGRCWSQAPTASEGQIQYRAISLSAWNISYPLTGEPSIALSECYFRHIRPQRKHHRVHLFDFQLLRRIQTHKCQKRSDERPGSSTSLSPL